MKTENNGKKSDGPAPRRCAIYTRKSTTEGLDSDFTSLDAQRDACEAYIRSQRGEGWSALADMYDDGGFSGGNVDRPALQRLMNDIEAGKIDCVVVYKIDRLSRSLLDFSRIVDVFEKHNVSFVSVTQLFNTATSMGRLMLNVLLSFAQFEREIISERTRDKIAAARKKGKWVGGYPILGYDIDHQAHRLVVNEAEAEQVREIFDLFIEKKSAISTVEALNEKGWKTKTWTTIKGKRHEGKPFNKSRLLGLLTNVAYIGKVRHKENVYEGEHPAIIDEVSWRRAQELLKKKSTRANHDDGRTSSNKYGALLKGLVRCSACGCTMVHTYSVTRGKRYRYYVCANAQKRGWNACPTKSTPAADLEDFVVGRMRDIHYNPKLIASTIKNITTDNKKKVKKLLSERDRLQKDISKSKGNKNGTSLRGKRVRLMEIEAEITCIENRDASRSEVRKAISVFDGVWDVLYPAERTRVMGLVLDRIEYNGPDGRLAITLNPAGVKTLAAEMKENTHLKKIGGNNENR